MFNTDYDINQVDPNIGYTYKEQTNAVIDNPFYNILTVEKFPGPLRYQQQVGVTDLARPYPQYGSILVADGQPGGSMKYQALQMKLTKAYSQGLSLLAGYSYHLESDQTFYDDIANYKRAFSWFDPTGRNTYRHRLTVAASWDLPIGRGKPLMTGASRLVDSIVGGWKFSPTMSWNSGTLLGFGGMVWDGNNPNISNATLDHWFNTDAFTRLPDYTPRTNPRYFDGLRGPQFVNWDAQLSKKVNITERVAGKFEVAAFNMFNNLRWDPPSTNVRSSNFGKIINQAYLSYGRRLQLGVRLEF